MEGNYEQPSQGTSDDWHFVSISAKPGLDKVSNERTSSSLFSIFILDKVFTWKNKAGIEWELALTKVEKGGKVLVFKVSQSLNFCRKK